MRWDIQFIGVSTRVWRWRYWRCRMARELSGCTMWVRRSRRCVCGRSCTREAGESKNMDKKRHYFGTDGVRGKVGDDPITPETILKLGWAAGRVLGKGASDHAKILIGKDKRISGYLLHSLLEAGLSAAGVDINLLGPMPTPAIAYLTLTAPAPAGAAVFPSPHQRSC